jgi:zinc transport system substrate-binding protein
MVTLAIGACSGGDERRDQAPAEGDTPLQVYAVNYPLQYFAERIGGSGVDVHFPAPPDGDPAYWSPDPETISRDQGADLILLSGAGYASWVELASLPESKLVNTSAGFEDRYIVMADAVTHTHGPEGDHEHRNLAFTTWLDPLLAVEQARSVLEAMVRRRPGQESTFREGFDSLESELGALDARLARASEAFGDHPVLFSHPVYQYLERRYELSGKSVHWEPDEAPEQIMLEELAGLLETHAAQWMIWEGAPGEDTRRKLRELGLEVIVYEPCGNEPDEGDFMSVMNRNAQSFEDLIGGNE